MRDGGCRCRWRRVTFSSHDTFVSTLDCPFLPLYMAREKHRKRQDGEKSNRMPHERSPLLERVPVAEPTDRYPHTNVGSYSAAPSVYRTQLTTSFRFVGSAPSFSLRYPSSQSPLLRSVSHWAETMTSLATAALYHHSAHSTQISRSSRILPGLRATASATPS